MFSDSWHSTLSDETSSLPGRNTTLEYLSPPPSPSSSSDHRHPSPAFLNTSQDEGNTINNNNKERQTPLSDWCIELGAFYALQCYRRGELEGYCRELNQLRETCQYAGYLSKQREQLLQQQRQKIEELKQEVNSMSSSSSTSSSWNREKQKEE